MGRFSELFSKKRNSPHQAEQDDGSLPTKSQFSSDASRPLPGHPTRQWPRMPKAPAWPTTTHTHLSTFDTIFLIDDSGSMAGRSWKEVKAVLANIAPICTAYDGDGIDVHFLNHKNENLGEPARGKATGGYNVTNETEVERIFKSVHPTAATPTGTRINAILRPYLRYYEQKCEKTGKPEETGVKPVNLIVITDGVPTDDLEGVLINIARKLDKLDAPPFQVGVQFFQVGNEQGAAEALRDLDDNLGDDVRDIVDTVSWNARDGNRPALTAEGILKTVLGSVNRREDRKNLPRVVVEEH